MESPIYTLINESAGASTAQCIAEEVVVKGGGGADGVAVVVRRPPMCSESCQTGRNNKRSVFVLSTK